MKLYKWWECDMHNNELHRLFGFNNYEILLPEYFKNLGFPFCVNIKSPPFNFLNDDATEPFYQWCNEICDDEFSCCYVSKTVVSVFTKNKDDALKIKLVWS